MLISFIILVVALYLVLEYLAPKLPAPIGTIVTIVVVLIAIIWLLNLIGFNTGMPIGRIG